MPVLDQLKKASSLNDLAEVLGYKPKGLAFILYHSPSSAKYNTFTIPKKSGGLRTIHAPEPRLKALQISLKKNLEKCNLEITPPPIVPNSVKPSIPKSLSHGFEKDRSIVTNAWAHKSRKFVFNVDLENFFPSINFGRVRGFFIKNRDYSLHPSVATIIAQICCFNGELAQGGPCSPLIANLVAHMLDVRLAQLCKELKCTYTRYADDLTFSTNQKLFPSLLAMEDEKSPGAWLLGYALREQIRRAGFTVNDTKTRMQRSPSQQTVTGLTVNSKVNIQASYYKTARAMCNTLFKTGRYYVKTLSPTPTCPAPVPEQHTGTACLEGIMSHIYYVKHLTTVMSAAPVITGDDKGAKGTRRVERSYPSYRTLYKKFLYYRHFVSLDMPLIVCEGPTDNIYLRSALKSLVDDYPRLGTLQKRTAPSKKAAIKSKIRFLKHSRVEHDILELSGGSGNLANLVARYNRSLYQYDNRPLNHPVIVLVDNDSGGTPVFEAMKSTVKIIPNLHTAEPFYYVCHNLYVIKTPESALSGTSCIEDLLPASVRATKIDGKSFSTSKDFDTKLFYGKLIFADKVVRANVAKIDFSEFRPLFDRIVAVLNDYEARLAAKKISTTSAKKP